MHLRYEIKEFYTRFQENIQDVPTYPMFQPAPLSPIVEDNAFDGNRTLF